MKIFRIWKSSSIQAIFIAYILLILPTLPVVKSQSQIQLADIQKVWALAFSPDGQILAIGGRVNDQPGIWLYDIVSEEVDVIETQGNVFYISWSPDGSQIAGDIGGGNATTFQIFDVAAKQTILTFEQTVSPSTILWDSDISRVATTDALTINIRNVNMGSLVLTCSLSETDAFGPLSNIVWDNSTNQRLYGLVGFDQKIYVWNSVTGDFLQRYDIPFHAEGFALSSDFSKLAVGSMDGDGDILILDAADGTSLLTLDGASDEFPQTLAWNPKNNELATFGGGFDGGSIRIWDTITTEETYTISVTDYITPSNLAWSPDGRQLAFSAGRGAVQFVKPGSAVEE